MEACDRCGEDSLTFWRNWSDHALNDPLSGLAKQGVEVFETPSGMVHTIDDHNSDGENGLELEIGSQVCHQNCKVFPHLLSSL